MLSLPRVVSFLFAVLFLAGCARFGAAGPEPTATPTFVAVPTFTPTPSVASAAAESTEDDAAAQADPNTSNPQTEPDVQPSAGSEADGDSVASALLPTATPPSVDAPPEESTTTGDEQTAETEALSEPSLAVSSELVNVRQGPGINYPVVGTATTGDTFTPTGRNDASDWWEVCCFAEEPGWLYGPLVEVRQGEAVAVASNIPPAPTPAPPAEPAAEAAPAEPVPEDDTSPAEAPPDAAPPAQALTPGVPLSHSGTAGNFDAAAQYHIVGYRVIGYGENNGGIFNNGGQHMIFINVIDAAGNGIDGAVVKNAIDDNIEIVTGPKGPGRAEFEMFWDPYKLYVASDPSGPVTSQVTNQMNTAKPHIPDVIGKLGPPEEEYAICPTPDDRCEPPFFHAHWSYEVIFQKVR